MTRESLRKMIGDGSFHHATYRNVGTLWEGLWVYVKDEDGLRGFSVAGCFNVSKPEALREAQAIVRETGTSLGSYGKG